MHERGRESERGEEREVEGEMKERRVMGSAREGVVWSKVEGKIG